MLVHLNALQMTPMQNHICIHFCFIFLLSETHSSLKHTKYENFVTFLNYIFDGNNIFTKVICIKVVIFSQHTLVVHQNEEMRKTHLIDFPDRQNWLHKYYMHTVLVGALDVETLKTLMFYSKLFSDSGRQCIAMTLESTHCDSASSVLTSTSVTYW